MGFLFPGELAIVLGGVLAYQGRASLPIVVASANVVCLTASLAPGSVTGTLPGIMRLAAPASTEISFAIRSGPFPAGATCRSA